MEPFEAPDDENLAPWFTAGFDGECSRDGCDIIEGDIIRSDHEGGWEKLECVDYDQRLNEVTPDRESIGAYYDEDNDSKISKRDENAIRRIAIHDETGLDTAVSDDELPGMWSNSDLQGGWADNS